VAVLRDWQRTKATLESNYPEAPITVVDVPLWSQDERDAYVRGRVQLHQNAEFDRLTGGTLPLCSDQERWKKLDSYAVMSGKNKRATRVFDSEAGAKSFIADKSDPKFHIEHRAGKCTRCVDNYCKVAQFCDQYQEEA
jgi:hypothetical protein